MLRVNFLGHVHGVHAALLGVGAQRTGRPDHGVDNVDSPVAGPGQVHGSFPGPVLWHSPFTRLVGRLPRTGDLATAAVRLLHRTTEPSSPRA